MTVVGVKQAQADLKGRTEGLRAQGEKKQLNTVCLGSRIPPREARVMDVSSPCSARKGIQDSAELATVRLRWQAGTCGEFRVEAGCIGRASPHRPLITANMTQYGYEHRPPDTVTPAMALGGQFSLDVPGPHSLR